MSTQVHILGQQQSLFTQFLSEIRDAEIQKDSLRFRRNLERLGEIFAYEISKVLEHRERDVQTPLGVAATPVLKSQPVLATILRATASWSAELLRPGGKHFYFRLSQAPRQCRQF
jgi:uracil phosphoribosyltransferase